MAIAEPFTISTIALPDGGRIGISHIPGRSGAPDHDIAAIAEWGAAAVVSMTDMAEMQACDCADLGDRLSGRSIAWFHVPVRDLGGPGAASLEKWTGIAPVLHAILDEGGAVLVHCHGGHGRAGMAALRLLVERGWPPEQALRHIRSVRPGAVQTERQYRWAASAAG